MAELSNDPIGDLLGDVTYEVNHQGSVRLAELAKEAGVERFVYMSSCSVYGVAEGTVDETSPTDPQTAYAECKALVERDVTRAGGRHFSPTFLRNATAFGASPRHALRHRAQQPRRPRLDDEEDRDDSDGTPWRPLVHGLDIAKAIRCVLDAPREAVHAQVLNVGSNEQNYQVREIAEIVGGGVPRLRGHVRPARRATTAATR